MTSTRLRLQFETLFKKFSGQNSEAQLDDITDALFCTRRNARIVLNKLEQEGWIEWHPSAGRGKLSKLIFKRSRNDVSEKLARHYLEEGKIGQALEALDNDATKLAQVIQGYLGLQHQQGEQVIRLPYYRPLLMLNPQKLMRRSELHIAQQVFSGLTRLDDEECLQPDLAHHWEALSDKHWRFYLRRGVRFHNGQRLTTACVIESIKELCDFNLFSHIESVSSPEPWTIDILLCRPDKYLPQSLSEPQAKILLPSSMRSEEFDTKPIGTGPFQIKINDEKRLILTAFDGYFGLRPLLDQVEIWVIDEAYSSIVYPSLSKPQMDKTSSADDVELDPGCTLLLLNKRSGLAKDPRWAEFLSQALNSYQIYAHLPQDKVVEFGILPAFGLKPGWLDLVPSSIGAAPQQGKPICVAYQKNHPVYPSIAQAIKQQLLPYDINITFLTYEYELPSVDDIDIWIKPMGITTRRDDVFAGWLLDYSNIEQASNNNDFSSWVTLVDGWRAGKYNDFPARELGRQLVKSCQVIPMFHCWLGVNKDHSGALQNAKCNALGWFDFSRVWVKPEIENYGKTK
ncbi:SgrR family transcriptional regulator [Vibrio azureus]|uniref:Putative transcriptional regulator n=1 Tax=Vibrio azureus NBRC 104587 TaxID=1219077 RepID=U3A4K3_9VIBR|nr:SgrR family transcriptional regulator [Vibrio azureus]AUI88184.1 SgrR family transcriptional regulator [Vibrio azureus]GAD74921.1 putative transcriptional regulator [Vibrio azureus NBRC 104587]